MENGSLCQIQKCHQRLAILKDIFYGRMEDVHFCWPEKKKTIINTTSVAVRSRQTQLLSSHLLILVLNRARRNLGNQVGMIQKPEQMIELLIKREMMATVTGGCKPHSRKKTTRQDGFLPARYGRGEKFKKNV